MMQFKSILKVVHYNLFRQKCLVLCTVQYHTKMVTAAMEPGKSNSKSL